MAAERECRRLVTFGCGRLSEVSLSATGKNGGLKNYYDSDDCFSIGAEASSYYRLGTRTVVAGAVGYDRFSGKRMSGSYFIDPTQTPFDLVEYTSDHAGDKQLESYRLNGAVGCDLTRRLAAGAVSTTRRPTTPNARTCATSIRSWT